jgi:hypothetical protein
VTSARARARHSGVLAGLWYGHEQCWSRRACRHSAPARAARHASCFRAHGSLCPARAFTGAGAPYTWAVAMRQPPLAAGARRPESADPGPAWQGRGFGYRRHGSRKRRGGGRNGPSAPLAAGSVPGPLAHSAHARAPPTRRPAGPPAVVGRRWASGTCRKFRPVICLV